MCPLHLAALLILSCICACARLLLFFFLQLQFHNGSTRCHFCLTLCVDADA